MRHNYQKACEIFGKCLYFDLDPKLEYVQDLVESYGYTLLQTSQYDTALQLANIYDEFKHSCEFVFLMGLIYMNNALFDQAIHEFQSATTFEHCKIEGSN